MVIHVLCEKQDNVNDMQINMFTFLNKNPLKCSKNELVILSLNLKKRLTL